MGWAQVRVSGGRCIVHCLLQDGAPEAAPAPGGGGGRGAEHLPHVPQDLLAQQHERGEPLHPPRDPQPEQGPSPRGSPDESRETPPDTAVSNIEWMVSPSALS